LDEKNNDEEMSTRMDSPTRTTEHVVVDEDTATLTNVAALGVSGYARKKIGIHCATGRI